MRFLVEIYQGMRQNLGQDYPIGLKINSTDFKTDGFSEADSLAVIGGFCKVESMIEAVSTTDVSMIGVARLLVIEPDLPNQIHTGTYQAATLPRLTTGVGFLDKKVGSLAAMSYYSQQMKRMGEGLAPRVHRNAWSPLLQSAFSHGPAALSPKRS